MYILFTILAPGYKIYYIGDNEFSTLKGKAIPMTFEKAEEIRKEFDFDLQLEKIN